MRPVFDKILVANRGEIALRIVRTCREMGISTVVVHSTEDRDSAAVAMADRSIQIGPAAPSRSYLNMAAIIEAALRTSCQAVHPGYGFLSEDADFAEICVRNGLTFIGPPPKVLAVLGDKSKARTLATRSGLPLLPGSLEPFDDLSAARPTAKRIGYPLIVKAVAGGGGRGMQVAHSEQDLSAAFARARADARSFFRDPRVYLERYVTQARHVEIQILRDANGTACHLGERDCSVQRRHQKILEETPAPGLPPALIFKICEAAVRGADAVGYLGAGTFEFLVDSDLSFYFMEVNSRIQVEHPVTEMVTGMDLVREQIRIAAGLPVDRPSSPRGAAIECRVNAEDPARDFAPTAGTLSDFAPPSGGFVRVDTHGAPGVRISPSYDPLLAKVTVWAPDRDTAMTRMRHALSDFRISGRGVRTNISFLQEVLDHPRFRAAEHSTSLVEQMRAASATADQ